MKKNYISLMFVIFSVLFVSMFATGVSAFSGGSGTLEDPYQISTCTELQAMETGLGLNYVLVNDIDCAATSFAPVGGFAGTFDGQNHKITGLSINRSSTDYIGLFGYISSGAIIKNVGLVNVNITGWTNVGGLVGFNYGTITNSYSTGSVTGSYNVGGLVGYNYGTITNSYATGNVTCIGYYRAGGLVGYNYGTITNSYATGSVTGIYIVGGLVGYNEGAITSSYATGSVTGTDSLGGLVGLIYGTITNSRATGSVTGTDSLGGLVGLIYGGSKIENSYSTGSVTGSHNVGGLVGNIYGGTIIIENSYWYNEQTNCCGYGTCAGCTKADAISDFYSSSYDVYDTNPPVWDFVNIWAIKEGVIYPYFLWQIPPITYKWTGFFQPVDNLPILNQVNAGRAIPVKFSLNGNMGLNIFAVGYPVSQKIACDLTTPIEDIETTVTAGGSSLTYDPIADQYIYVWKTDKSWTGCRQLVVKLNDGTSHYANFKFK